MRMAGVLHGVMRSCGFLSGVGLVAVLLSCCAPAGWCCDAGLWDRLGLA